MAKRRPASVVDIGNHWPAVDVKFEFQNLER